MRLPFPLYSKILFWFFGNLVLLGVVLYLMLFVQFDLGLKQLVTRYSGQRLFALRKLVDTEFRSADETWQQEAVLRRFTLAYGVGFQVVDASGNTVVGEEAVVPASVVEEIEQVSRQIKESAPGARSRPGEGARDPERRPPRDGQEGDPERSGSPPPRRGEENGETMENAEGEPMPPEGSPRPRPPRPPGERPRGEGIPPNPGGGLGPGGNWEPGGPDRLPPRAGERGGELRSQGPPRREGGRPGGPQDNYFIVQTKDPRAYWIGLPMLVNDLERPGGMTHGFLLVRSETLSANGLLFDPVPWLIVGVSVLALCVVYWMPFVHGITRYLRQMTAATEAIANGRFGKKVNENRGDELGRLGTAINRLSTRLEGFVTGQKRFLGDIAHELCSPIARIQMSLGILEQKTPPEARKYIDGVHEETQHLSEMVNELLSFSKASLLPKEVKLETLSAGEIVEEAIHREGGGAEIEVKLEEELSVLASRNMLLRSLTNLIRNAVRYAGDAGPITISGKLADDGEWVELVVSDHGPGIAREALDSIFDPFYRPEAARDRESGGVGLGLAIVKTCIEACGGTVTCANQTPRGLDVTLRIPAAK